MTSSFTESAAGFACATAGVAITIAATRSFTRVTVPGKTRPVSKLAEVLLTDEIKPKLVTATTKLVDDEVRAKSGLSGMAIKAGYKAVNAIKPTLVREAVDNLLPKFVDKLEPFFTAWVDGGKSGTFGAHLKAKPRDVANALLAVTDDRAKNVDNKTIKKTYEKLRPQGEKNVEAAVPGLGRTLDQFIS